MSLRVDFRQCLAVPLLESLADNSLAAIFADPPFKASENTISTPDLKTIDATWDKEFVDPRWYDLAFGKLRPGGHLIVCGTIHNMRHVLDNAARVGFGERPHQEIVYYKPLGKHTARKVLFFRHQNLWWWVKPGAPYTFNDNVRDHNGRRLTDVWTIMPRRDEWLKAPDGSNLHPTQKPEEMGRRLVAVFTDPGQTVCDPFAGTGTFLSEATKAGRHVVGCEPVEKYYIRALARIERSVHENRIRESAFSTEAAEQLGVF